MPDSRDPAVKRSTVPPKNPSRREVLRAVAGIGAVAVAAPLSAPQDAEAFGKSTTASGPLAPVRYRLALSKEDMAPVGRPQGALVVNGVLPAPEIRFREGFLLRTEVINGLEQPTAFHFHGLPVPNPMDGEIGITQLPIRPGNVSIYEFPAAEPGTYWYHSTVGFQRQLGLAGAFVVEERENPYGTKRDQVVFLSDWETGDPAAVLSGLRKRGGKPKASTHERFVNPGPDGKPFPSEVNFSAFLMNGHGHGNAWTCKAAEGDRVRLRVINGSSQTFFRFMVTGHRLEVVAADGRAVEPVVVDDLVIGIGERYDVIVTVGEQGAYAIRAAALGQSGGAVGVLHTPDAKPVVSTVPPRWEGERLRYDMLRAKEPRTLPEGPRRNLRISLAEVPGEYRYTINGKSFPEDPTAGTAPGPLRIQPGERVRMEIDNKTSQFQSMHLHGHVFRLLLDGVDPAVAPRKDTLIVAPGERTHLEFAADNPGRWLLDSVALYRRRAGLARVVAYLAGTATI
ncbi:MAG: multicopper oxidase family protein [Candidatus Binatia bacterium]|nr:multicopper oxidase family protein [Candidatus Binatia bacterium]